MESPPQVAIVTGGNSGMGAALTRDLVKRGWKVAIADIQENKELEKELGDGASFYKCNVADYDRCVFLSTTCNLAFDFLLPNSQAEMFQGVWNKYGQIDALCANAGIVDRRYLDLTLLHGVD